MREVRVEALEGMTVRAVCPSAIIGHYTFIVLLKVPVVTFVHSGADICIATLCDSATKEAIIGIIEIPIITLFQEIIHDAVPAFVHYTTVETVVVIGKIRVIAFFTALIYKSVSACGESAPACA